MTKILIVEDNDMNLELVQDILSGVGIDWISATSGMEALKLLQQNTVDLILMDLQMPGMDGFQAFAAIREQMTSSTPPTIAVTGNAMEADRKRCFDDGFCDFIRKPFRVSKLLTTIHNHLEK